MSIPDEAVEAAFIQLFAEPVRDWASKDEIEDHIARTKAALEAAAPHLMAQAWEEGGEAAIEREHAYGREEKAKFRNPYLPAPSQ